MPDPLNFGHLIEGTVEQDPITDRLTIRTVDADGKPVNVDLQELIGQFVGKEVRFTLASVESLNRLAQMVEEGGGGGRVLGIGPEELPVPFNIQRKP